MTNINNGSVTSPLGFKAVAQAAGLKKDNQLDLALIYSDRDCACAGVFTKNQVVAAPVIVDRQTIKANPAGIRAVVINAKNANACTGIPGLTNARQTQLITANALGLDPQQILIMSTGVIGVQLPLDKLQAGIETAVNKLQQQEVNAWKLAGQEAAQAIMTTDTRPKHVSLTVDLPEGQVTIGGMAKGAGMIHPNLATMLALITTDAHIAPDLLDALLKTAVNQSFNHISIDGDTSTNDTVLLLANGATGTGVATGKSTERFRDGLITVCQALAQQIVRDGEGATKFVEIQVKGTETNEAAHQIANTIAISPLVKTAFAGSDANWGRLLMAAGRAGIPFNQDVVNLWVGIDTGSALQLVAGGTPTDYGEADAARIFAQPEFKILLEVGPAEGTAVVWTCDLSHDYVTINADYRT